MDIQYGEDIHMIWGTKLVMTELLAVFLAANTPQSKDVTTSALPSKALRTHGKSTEWIYLIRLHILMFGRVALKSFFLNLERHESH